MQIRAAYGVVAWLTIASLGAGCGGRSALGTRKAPGGNHDGGTTGTGGLSTAGGVAGGGGDGGSGGTPLPCNPEAVAAKAIASGWNHTCVLT
ncbi:MAG TPA: hypothetical protein VIM14_18075, partial [Polyangia bacterium]